MNNNDTIKALRALYSTVISTHPKFDNQPEAKEATRKFIDSLCNYLSELDGDGLLKTNIMNN